MEASPLIITLALNKEAFAFFDSLRRTYFPAERNFLQAHLTLFHHLPPHAAGIEETIHFHSSSQEVLLLQVTDVVSIGKGVAFKIESVQLQKLHKALQEKWYSLLTPQDRQKLWPHITIQNKVAPAVAKETLNVLRSSFQPFTIYGTGLSLWSYEGGPWTFIKTFPFQPASRFPE